MFSVLALVCVAYLNGNEHCDVRFKHNYDETKAQCLHRGNAGAIRLSLDAAADEEVDHITSITVKCDTRENTEALIATIPDYMDSSDTSYVLTEY